MKRQQTGKAGTGGMIFILSVIILLMVWCISKIGSESHFEDDLGTVYTVIFVFGLPISVIALLVFIFRPSEDEKRAKERKRILERHPPYRP
jgi:hypothetical protein